MKKCGYHILIWLFKKKTNKITTSDIYSISSN